QPERRLAPAAPASDDLEAGQVPRDLALVVAQGDISGESQSGSASSLRTQTGGQSRGGLLWPGVRLAARRPADNRAAVVQGGAEGGRACLARNAPSDSVCAPTRCRWPRTYVLILIVRIRRLASSPAG